MASNSKRQTVVFTALLTVLGGTSLLLLAIRPAPLAGTSSPIGDASVPMPPGLMAAEQTPPSTPIASAGKPVAGPQRVAQWTSVFIRSTKGGSAEMASGDHFVILPGLTSAEGRLLVNPAWKSQHAAATVKGVTLPEGCVTIVIAGDFDRTQPTPGQLQTLRKLLDQLQTKFGVNAVPLVVTQASNPAFIGRNFPQIWSASTAGK